MKQAKELKGWVPVKQMTVISSFLHLCPKAIIRLARFSDPIRCADDFPEVILMLDRDDALDVCRRLNLYYTRITTPDESGVIRFPGYRVDKFDDVAFYSYVHRVPVSLQVLKQLETRYGVPFVTTINEV